MADDVNQARMAARERRRDIVRRATQSMEHAAIRTVVREMVESLKPDERQLFVFELLLEHCPDDFEALRSAVNAEPAPARAEDPTTPAQLKAEVPT